MTRSILITGAAHGMGRELVRRAVSRGDQVFAATLDGETLAGEKTPANLHHLRVDVGSDGSVEDMYRQADDALAGRPLDRIVNCAGVSPSGAIEVEPISTLQHVLNVNAVGSARMLRAGLPRLRGHGGRIILFASLWGRVGGPMLSGYCASKHAVEAIVDCARRETLGQGVDIVLIEPGVVRTNMVTGTVTGSRAGADRLAPEHRALYGDIYEKFAAMIAREASGGVSVEAAADVIEKALLSTSPKTRYRIGKDAKAVIGLAKILPDRAFDAIFRSMLDRK